MRSESVKTRVETILAQATISSRDLQQLRELTRTVIRVPGAPDGRSADGDAYFTSQRVREAIANGHVMTTRG